MIFWGASKDDKNVTLKCNAGLKSFDAIEGTHNRGMRCEILKNPKTVQANMVPWEIGWGGGSGCGAANLDGTVSESQVGVREFGDTWLLWNEAAGAWGGTRVDLVICNAKHTCRWAQVLFLAARVWARDEGEEEVQNRRWFGILTSCRGKSGENSLASWGQLWPSLLCMEGTVAPSLGTGIHQHWRATGVPSKAFNMLPG